MNSAISDESKYRFLRILGSQKEVDRVSPDREGGYRFTAGKCELYLNNIQLTHLITDGLVSIISGNIAMTKNGRNFLRRYALGKVDKGNSAHMKVSRIGENHPNKQKPQINTNESPISRLNCRKAKDGTRYLSDIEFEAGERIRRDFEKANMQPSLSMQFSALQQNRSNSKNSVKASDITDFAIDARARVNKAMDAIGPELSGTVLDICCFLKGFELVERERKWPPRSAKLMLKTGLSKLARHYGYGCGNKTTNGNISHWGSTDYRPKIRTVGSD